jgi:hypothetical protein
MKPCRIASIGSLLMPKNERPFKPKVASSNLVGRIPVDP